MSRGVETAVDACHDEADDTLEEDTDREGVAGADPVAEEGTADGTGEIEDIDEGVPAKGFPERGAFAEDNREPGRRIDAEGVGRKVVDEPDEGDDC